MMHVVLLATTGGDIVFHSQPLPLLKAMVVRSEVARSAAHHAEHLTDGERFVGPVIMCADRQDRGRFDRARA